MNRCLFLVVCVLCTYNLKLDGLSFQLDGADLEINANGRDVALRVGVIGKTQEQAGLSHARVSN